jgi:hypothetical protein
VEVSGKTGTKKGDDGTKENQIRDVIIKKFKANKLSAYQFLKIAKINSGSKQQKYIECTAGN